MIQDRLRHVWAERLRGATGCGRWRRRAPEVAGPGVGPRCRSALRAERRALTEATTLRHYVKRTPVAPDVRVVLDLLVNQPDSDSPRANVMGK
jgi:hypothetical protein